MADQATGGVPEGWFSIRSGSKHHGVSEAAITRLIKSGSVMCQKFRMGNFEQWFIEPQSLELAISRERSGETIVHQNAEEALQEPVDVVQQLKDPRRDMTDEENIGREWDRLQLEVSGGAVVRIGSAKDGSDICRLYLSAGQTIVISAPGVDPGRGR